jgi:hypothetical protein
MIKRKKTYNIKRFSIAALFLYFLLLANISFHHHVFDISTFNPSQIETSSTDFAEIQSAVLDCPIVHFAQNSFQSMAISNSFEFQINNSALFSFESSNKYSSTLNLHKNLRAPPSNS